MQSKVHSKVETTSDALFYQGIQLINGYTSSLPTVSPKDKKGRKLNKKVLPLVQKAIDSAPKLENHLKRDFTTQNLIDNKAALDSNLDKVKVLLEQVDRLLSTNTCIGKEIDLDYRAIYAASQDAAQDDVAMISIRDELGAPFQKKAAGEGKKGKKVPKTA